MGYGNAAACWIISRYSWRRQYVRGRTINAGKLNVSVKLGNGEWSWASLWANGPKGPTPNFGGCADSARVTRSLQKPGYIGLPLRRAVSYRWIEIFQRVAGDKSAGIKRCKTAARVWHSAVPRNFLSLRELVAGNHVGGASWNFSVTRDRMNCRAQPRVGGTINCAARRTYYLSWQLILCCEQAARRSARQGRSAIWDGSSETKSHEVEPSHAKKLPREQGFCIDTQ